MKKFLTRAERRRLIKQHKSERDKRVCDRIKAVLLHDQNYTYAEIANILLLDDETIRRHVKDYETSQKLTPANGGSENRLNDDETALLISHLQTKMYVHAKDICNYIETAFKKTYSTRGMTRWLKANNFCYKKPHAVPAKADQQAQAKFIKDYKGLKRKDPITEPILFADSVHPHHQTQLAYGWILRGKRYAVKTTGRQYRLNIMGSISLHNHHVEHLEADKIEADSIKQFFKQLSAAYPLAKKIHIILDNAGYHRSKDVRAFTKAHRIKLHYLPPYSPNLNPIERLWKVMRERVTYNHYYETFSQFSHAIREFLNNTEKIKSILQTRITDNFQTLDNLTFAS